MCEVYATQLRTAWRFKDVWQAWLEQIKRTTDSYRNLITVARDKLTPDFWDHPPIAQILSEAWHGTHLEPIKAQVAATVKSKLDSLSFEVPDLSRESQCNKVTVQKWAYPEFLRLLYPDDLAIVLQRRLQKIIGPNFNPDSLAPALLIVKSLKPHIAVQVIKTWSNAWATTHRFHQARRLPCLFGCLDAPDCLNHYAFCPFVINVMEQTAGTVLSRMPSHTPACMLGLENPCRTGMKGVAATFYAYHSVSLHPAARALQSMNPSQQIPTTDIQLFQQIFAGSFEAAFKHAC